MSSSSKVVKLNNAHDRRKQPAIRGAILDLCSSSDEDSDMFQDLRTRISKRQSKSNKSAPQIQQNALASMLPLIDISFPDNKENSKQMIEKKKQKKTTKTAKKGIAAIAKQRRKAMNGGDVRLCSVQLCRADFIRERDQVSMFCTALHGQHCLCV